MTAVAYLRRSRVDARRPGALSHEQQLERIRQEAARHGDDELLTIEDWGKSGREDKTHLRAGFARLEAMIEAGEVSAVYAYDLSRLGRSLITVDRLTRRCAELGIPVRCADGFSPDVSNPQGQLVLNILSAIGQFYAESTRERMQALTMMRRQRGDRIGPAPFGFRVVGGKLEPNPAEDLEVLRDAYRRAGGVQAACRLLNAEGVPTRGGRPWQPSTLAQVLEIAGDVVRRPRPGRPATRTFLLSGLLRCLCGATLTGRVSNGGTNVSYECKRARLDPAHPRPSSVAERQLEAWVHDEAARFRRPGALVEVADDDPEARRADLEGRRQRVLDNYEDGLIDRSARNDKLAAIDKDLGELERPARLEAIPAAIDWTWPSATRNTVLRALWERVDLDPQLRPITAAWTVPEWRA